MAKTLDKRLYRVKVKGGGSFIYDTTDVGRFFQRMVIEGDPRPIKVRPARTRWYL